LAGELGCPRAELDELDVPELGRPRNGVPQPERPLDVCDRLSQAEHGLRLASRVDRGDERICSATRRRPVRREFRWLCGPAAHQLHGQSRVQLLALARQDRRVDRLSEQRVPKAETATRPVGDQDAVLDRAAQRLAHLAFWKRRDCAEQRVRDVASGGRGHPQKGLGPTVESGHALQQ
jgi:hypothetical protein